MANPFVQKLIWTALAVGVYALTAVPSMAGVAEPLKVLAGLIVGAAWVARPGDAKVAVMLLALCTLPMLHACATWSDAKPVARTVNDIARDLCEATMGAEAERQGITVRDLCMLPYVFAPFLQAPQDALAAAKMGGPVPEPCE